MDPLTDERLDDVDLEAALAATYEHRDRLVAAHRRRARAVMAGGLLLFAAGGTVLGLSLRDTSTAVPVAGDDSRTTAPATSSTTAGSDATATTAATAGVVPDGFTLTTTADGTMVLRRTDTSSPTSPSIADANGAVVGGGGAVIERTVEVVSHTVDANGVVAVKFACVGGSADRIDEVAYRLDGTVLAVDARISSERGAQPCTELDGAVTPLPGITVTDPVEVLAQPVPHDG